jgi:hypothetical protein
MFMVVKTKPFMEQHYYHETSDNNIIRLARKCQHFHPARAVLFYANFSLLAGVVVIVEAPSTFGS